MLPRGAYTVGDEAPRRRSSLAHRVGAALAVRADVAVGGGDHDGGGRRVRAARDAAAALRPLVVSGVWVRAGVRLAFVRRHNGDVRGNEGGISPLRGRDGDLRGGREGSDEPEDARGD